MWNRLLARREDHLPRWEAQKEDGSALAGFYAERFMVLTESKKPMKEIDLSIVAKTLDHVVVKKDGTLVFYLLDGTKDAVEPAK